MLLISTFFEVEINVYKDIIISANGMNHEAKVLSQGYNDAVDICFRFGLIDAMYPKGKTYYYILHAAIVEII